MDDTKSQIYVEFLRLVKAGDESAARSFLESRFKEFPETFQAELALSLFEEFTAGHAQGARRIARTANEAADALGKLTAMRANVNGELEKLSPESKS